MSDPIITVTKVWVNDADRRAAFAALLDALSEAKRHICQNGCGRVGENHCTRCQELSKALEEARPILEQWNNE